ncbi:MAG: glutamate racemase [Eubacteriales bacterium]|nr:glutamate racemase [Eubacteriales bacterium]
MSKVIAESIDRADPIGVFDSGLGGLTVLKEMLLRLPNESTVYFGDSGRSPYGTKSRETIIHFAEQDAEFLLSKGVKMIVIACNTASSFAYEHLKTMSRVPVVEVITPGAMAAVRATRNGKIGVIGTLATVSSNVYDRALNDSARALRPDMEIEVFSAACPLFVGLAEEGWWDDEITHLTARRYLDPLISSGVDTLVLGCTHYPLLKNAISEVMGKKVKLIDSAGEVVSKVIETLGSSGIANTGDESDAQTVFHEFFTSDSEEKFKALGSSFLGKEIENARKTDIERFN